MGWDGDGIDRMRVCSGRQGFRSMDISRWDFREEINTYSRRLLGSWFAAEKVWEGRVCSNCGKTPAAANGESSNISDHSASTNLSRTWNVSFSRCMAGPQSEHHPAARNSTGQHRQLVIGPSGPIRRRRIPALSYLYDILCLDLMCGLQASYCPR